MSNATSTTTHPLRFTTKDDAAAWLKATHNYGMLHDSVGGWIAVQFADGCAWAFTAADDMVLLPGW